MPSLRGMQSNIPTLDEDALDDLLTLLNPVARYRFNEPSGVTLINHGSAGAVINGTFTPGAGAVGQDGIQFPVEAYNFDGADSVITIANHASIQGLATFCTWFLFKADSTGEGEVGTFLFKSGELLIRFSGPILLARAEHSTTNATAVTTTTVSTGVWHSLMVTLSTDKVIRLYLDGVEMAYHASSTTGVGTRASTTNTLILGGVGAAQSWDGLMDDLVLAPTIPSLSLIQALHTTGLGVPVGSAASSYGVAA